MASGHPQWGSYRERGCGEVEGGGKAWSHKTTPSPGVNCMVTSSLDQGCG